jgi:protein O-mannosyl-transferase
VTRAKTPTTIRAKRGKKPDTKITERSAPFVRGNGPKALACFLLTGAIFTLYLPVMGYSFLVFDDRDYVTANFHIHGGLSWNTVKWAFTSTTAANWHPLTWLSHALDYQLFAVNAAGHHFDSVLIHALNTVLLFLVLAWITERVGPSLFVAALFAVHPINVESVVWVAERKSVLSTFFFLSAIAAYVWYARKPDWRRYLLVAGLFAAGLMAKPMVITLPCVLLLLDYWPLGRVFASRLSALRMAQSTGAKLVLEKVPLLFLSAVSAWITYKVQQTGYAVRTLQQFPLAIRLENAVLTYGLYLWKMFWPARLALYPHSAIAIPVWQWLLSAVILTCISILVVSFRHKRYLPVGWLWFLGTLVPVIGLVQVGEASMADRYAYIPLIGIFIMIVWGLADLADAKNVRTVWRVIPAVCVGIALSVVTRYQMGYWESDYDLWEHALSVSENPFAHDAMGSALLDPQSAMTASDLQSVGTDSQRIEMARGHFERALDLRRELAQQNPVVYLPDTATTLNNLGNLDRLQKRTENARQHYEAALEIHRRLVQQNLEQYLPDMAMVLNNLALFEESIVAWEMAGQHFEEALNIYRRVAQQDPDQYLPKVAEVLNSMAFVERNQKHFDESRQHYEEALRIRQQFAEQDPNAYLPYLATTLNDLGILDAIQKRADEARQHYEEALKSYRQLAQGDREAYLPYVAATLNNLALVDEGQNRLEESRAHFKEDLSIYQELAQNDSGRYAGDIARVEANLQELEQKASSR